MVSLLCIFWKCRIYTIDLYICTVVIKYFRTVVHQFKEQDTKNYTDLIIIYWLILCDQEVAEFSFKMFNSLCHSDMNYIYCSMFLCAIFVFYIFQDKRQNSWLALSVWSKKKMSKNIVWFIIFNLKKNTIVCVHGTALSLSCTIWCSFKISRQQWCVCWKNCNVCSTI